MSDDLTIAVIAKEPVPGKVKTRLIPPCSPEQAAALAEAMLVDTLSAVTAAPASRRLIFLEGRTGDWLPKGFDVVPQVDGSLDLRLAHVLDAVDGPVMLIGMDTPQLTPDRLRCDFDTHPAWLGRTEDGGYWTIGLAKPHPDLINGVPMSVPYTFAAQHLQLVDAGFTVGMLPPERDVDTWADALAVADRAPNTRFARTLASIRSQAASSGR